MSPDFDRGRKNWAKRTGNALHDALATKANDIKPQCFLSVFLAYTYTSEI